MAKSPSTGLPSSSSTQNLMRDGEGRSSPDTNDEAAAAQRKVTRRRWHVPQQLDLTASVGSEMARVGTGRSTGGSPQASPTLVRRSPRPSADHAPPLSSPAPVAAPSSETALFASEVKRFSKESFARGGKNLRRKFNRFFKDNPAFAFPDDGSDGSDDLATPDTTRRDEEDRNSKRRRRRGAIALFWVELVLPCVGWIRRYNLRACLAADVIAGCSVAMMVVPQSISYAALAGLPSQFGLYTALIPVFVYALFGSSRQLAVGPVAIVSLLMKEGLHKVIPDSLAILDPNNPDGEAQQATQLQYNLMAIQITFIVGVIEFAMGLLRLGFLTNFLSHSVILGFTHGSAIIIGLSQVKHVIGIKAGNAKGNIVSLIKSYIAAGDTFDWRVLVMGLSFLAILVTMKEIGKRAGSKSPLKWFRTVGPLTTSILGIVICYAARLDRYGIPLVGNFDGGFPSVTYGELFPLPGGAEFITTAISCALVGLLESVSIAKRLATKNKYALYANQELRALGLSNLAGAGFNAYPATGSFSRSAVSNDTGCKTQLGSIVTALLVLLVVLFITKPFYYMPMSALGAIVISGVIGLLDIEEALYLFRLSKMDFLVWMTSFFGTLFGGAELGLGIAVGLALLIVIYQTSFPKIVELGRLHGTTVYRNLKQYPHAKRLSSVMILRVGAPIYFANCSYVREMFDTFLEKHERAGHSVGVVIMEMSPVGHVDATAMHVLKDMMEDFVEVRGIRFMIANPNPQVMRSLQHDEKIWEMLNPCGQQPGRASISINGCGDSGKSPSSHPTHDTLDSVPDSIECVPNDALVDTLRDKKGLYYGSHNSNLFVRVHDAVKEAVWYLRDLRAKDSQEIEAFDEEAQNFFMDLGDIV